MSCARRLSVLPLDHDIQFFEKCGRFYIWLTVMVKWSCFEIGYYIPEIFKFRGYYVFGCAAAARQRTPTPTPVILHKNGQKAYGVSNCVINSPINFISGIAIDNT